MPPRKTRKAAQPQPPTPAKRGRKPAASASAAAADPQPVTPNRRTSRKDSKSEEGAPPPPDTVGMTRRTRRASAENIPQPSPSTAKPRRSPRKAKAKAAAPKAAAPRGRRKTELAPAPEEEEEPNDVDHASGNLSDNGLDSADEEALLATPTRKRGGARVSLLHPSDSTGESDVFIEILKEAPEKKETKQPAKRGRKRKVVVEAENHSAEDDMLEEQTQRSPLAGRGSKRQRNAEGSDELVFGEEPQTPTKTRQRGRDLADEDSGYLDIVSPSKFERSRALIAAPKQNNTESKASKASDTDKWREKYNDLFSLRFTKAEGDYKDYKKSAEERFQAADDLIEKLRKDIAELKLKAKRKQDTEDTGAADKVSEMAEELQKKSANEKELEKQVTQLAQSVETLKHDLLVKDESIERLEQHRKLTETSTDYNIREKLKTVQEVTGFSVEDVVAEDEGVSYMCKQSGPNSTASYVLTVFDDVPNEYQYTPYGETTSLGSLPEYFKEPMSFDRGSASMFFWRMCDHLHQSTQCPGADAGPNDSQTEDKSAAPSLQS